MQKLHAHPYTITGISECGNVYVKDIWGKVHKMSLPPNQLKPHNDANYISSDEDMEQHNTEEISAINSLHHQNLLSSRIFVIHDKSDVSPKHKKSKIELNIHIDKIPIELMDEIEKNHMQTAINES